jgi:ribosomal protein S12 methylthiotransferase
MADILLVNTCAFIQSAKEESIEEILRLAAIKSSNGHQKRLLISGCLAQRYQNELLGQIPEIDGMIGIDAYDKIGSILDNDAAYVTRPPRSYREFSDVQILRDRPYAYLKIADGCSNRCSYCAIPTIRGEYRSRPLAAIAAQVDRLLENGTLELNLIAQDVAQYGFDIGKRPLDLLKMLEEKPGDFWMRPFYLHPLHLTDDILDFFAASEKFCSYLESPIQHISTKLLRKMNRGYDQKHVYRMIDRIRQKLPGAVWRTTFIVGFPGETDADFEQLCSFVEETKICRAGVFGFSREEGTPAYGYRRLVPQGTIAARQEELTRLINENAEEYNESLIGRRLTMLVEGFDRETSTVTGRLFCDAPEIDFTMRVPSTSQRRRGFRQVTVTHLTPEGFSGEFVGHGRQER